MFLELQEKTLANEVARVAGSIDAKLKREDFSSAMTDMAGLRAPVDAFFDKVKVNADDPKVRHNRLRLLWSLNDVFHTVADFSKIEG